MGPPACRGPWDELGARSRRATRGRQARRSRPRPRVWRSARCAAQKADRSGPRAPSDPRLLVYDRGAQHLRRARYAPSHELAALQGRQGALPRRPPQGVAILWREVASAIIERPKWRSGLLGVPTRDRRVYWGLREHPLRLSALGWLIGLLCAGCTRHAQVCDCGVAGGEASPIRPATCVPSGLAECGWSMSYDPSPLSRATAVLLAVAGLPARAAVHAQHCTPQLPAAIQQLHDEPAERAPRTRLRGPARPAPPRRHTGRVEAWLRRGPRARVAHSASWAAPHTTSAAAANAASVMHAPSGSSTLGHAI